MFHSPLLTNEIQQLTLLADRLRENGHYEAATEALMLALRLRPADPTLRTHFEEALDQYINTEQHPSDTAVPIKFMRRHVVDAAHLMGLAHLYVDQDKLDEAMDCLEVAKSRSDTNPSLYKLHGRILMVREEYDQASKQLEVALMYNPFDRQSAELLSESESYLGRYENALRSTIHAYILLRDSDRSAARELQADMQTLAEQLHWNKRRVQRTFRERQDFLSSCFERLRQQREQYSIQLRAKANSSEVGGDHEPVLGAGNRLRIASTLREFRAINHLSDEVIFRLSEIAEERLYSVEEPIVSTGGEGSDLSFLVKGRAILEYPSAYGPIRFSEVDVGDLFGERNFVLGSQRSGQIVALEPCRVLHLDDAALARWIKESPEFGVQIYWCVWHELARKLRQTNNRMQAFVSSNEDSHLSTGAPAQNRTGPEATVPSRDKIAVFREQGLSEEEIDSIADYAKQLEYPGGSQVFCEGDYGDEMYVIVDGCVIISKQVPGGGEEALGVLKRGEFFGEMSLLDGQPRSADARVDDKPATLLSISRSGVDRVLSKTPSTARHLLDLLCRLLARRSSEIDQKIVTWSIIAGQQNSSDELQIS